VRIGAQWKQSELAKTAVESPCEPSSPLAPCLPVGRASLEVELDQCWDLLRQRRARREFGQDPNDARVRPASVVERYKQ
jgi:hypothetical protein